MSDITAWWVFFKRHEKQIGNLLLMVVIFLGGWHVGRVMSPYYATSEIIFQDRTGAEVTSSGGSGGELEALKEEGIAARKPQAAQAVAGTQQTQGEFVASVNSNLYHHVSCSTASRIKPENRVVFASSAEAEAAGYEPSQCAREKLGK